MDHLVVCDPDILDGLPVFRGTRVPVKTLFDYLAEGQPLAEFLDDFPGVKQQNAEAVILAADKSLELAVAS